MSPAYATAKPLKSLWASLSEIHFTTQTQIVKSIPGRLTKFHLSSTKNSEAYSLTKTTSSALMLAITISSDSHSIV